MSVYLLNQVVAHVRSQFTPDQVVDVQPYGGEFTAAEVGKLSYNCPAILITVLGWDHPEGGSRRMAGRHVQVVRMAAFVATKGANRSARMAAAMTLAERLSLVLKVWCPQATADPVEVAAIEGEPRCENMFGRAIDALGQALWLVSWQQCIKPTVALPQLFDLLAVHVDNTARQGVASLPDAPAGAPITVTEAVAFAPLPPA